MGVFSECLQEPLRAARPHPSFRPPRDMNPLSLTVAIATSLLAVLLPVRAYIPAIPTNDTNAAVADGLNLTDISRVYLQWYNVIG
jgi:hypothetical protein